MRRPKNPLLSVPPEGIHGLGAAGGEFFRKSVGRAPKPEDYHGVHTTTDENIAAVYATGATYKGFFVDHYIENRPGAYPVILALDVSGLQPLPDVDALAQAAYYLGDSWLRSSYYGVDLQEALESYHDYEFLGPGNDVGSAVMEMAVYSLGPASAFYDLPDGEEQWQTWIETGAYSEDVAIAMVKQKRYLADFGLDRLVAVRAMKPWWGYVLEDAEAGEEYKRQIEQIEDLGYRAVTVDDLLNENVLTTTPIYTADQSERRVEYHGTSSWHLMQAFPEISVPPSPFPLSEMNPEDVDLPPIKLPKLKKRLLR